MAGVVAGLARLSAGRLLAFVGSAVGAGVVVAVVLVLLQQPVPPAESSRVGSAVVDVSDLPGWWQANYGGASWFSAVSGVPSWDGNVLTAKTSLTAGQAAREPATSICGALSAYWLTKPGKLEDSFRSVRVVDAAGDVLVSRHTVGEQCTWRR